LGEMKEVAIMGKRPVPKSVFRATYHLDEDRIKDINKHHGMKPLLEGIPLVSFKGDLVLYNEYVFSKIIIDDEINKPLEYVSTAKHDPDTRTFKNDDAFLNEILNNINPENVKSIYVSVIHEGIPDRDLFSGKKEYRSQRDIPETELVIICKSIHDVFDYGQKNNFKIIQPYGYQKPVEFYAPKYDTPEARANLAFDQRTTIHWQPDVRTDNMGMAAFSFYTADAKSTYTVIIEGVTDDGKMIRQEAKIMENE